MYLSLFIQSNTRQPELDSAEIYKGFVGSYPQTIFSLKHSKLSDFTKQLKAVVDKVSYANLLETFAVRRTDLDFWQVSVKYTPCTKKSIQ
jgi:hypothetical protein